MSISSIIFATLALGGAAVFLLLMEQKAVSAAGVPESTAGAGQRPCAKTEGSERWQRPAADEIKRRLTPEQYRVTQEEATEPPFRNAYWDNKEDGIYIDRVSGEPLFSSREKFDSGTGWPSFHSPLEPDLVVEREDRTLWMTRTEVRSRHGDSHLGHVFDDGPAPTGRRYCINSASLRFIPAADLEKEGYGEYAALFAANPAAPDAGTAPPGPEKQETGSADAGTRNQPPTEVAIFGMGCFWGAEADFCGLRGVVDTKVGYAGGSAKDPNYQKVSSGRTGHAEVVRVEYDPGTISYAELLEVFWRGHDPTTPDRQGPDVGSQYRSLILVRSPEQEAAARASLARHAGDFRRPIVTEIALATAFYPAEEYHQRYLQKQGRARCGR